MFLSKLFGTKKPTLAELSEADLEREILRLEEQQRHVSRRIKGLEDRKRKLFDEGRKAASDAERRDVAVRIKMLGEEQKAAASEQRLLLKQIQIAHRVLLIKRKEKILKQSGLWDLVKDLDPTQLESWVTDLKVSARSQDLQAERMLAILGETLEEGAAADPELDSIMDLLSESRDADLSDEAEWERIKRKLPAGESDAEAGEAESEGA